MKVIEWMVCNPCAAYTIGTAHTVTLDNGRLTLQCNECRKITYPEPALFYALHPTVKSRLGI